MKTIIESINSRVDEARTVGYSVSFVGFEGRDIELIIPASDQKDFEKWAGEGGPAQDEVFAHITGGNIDEY